MITEKRGANRYKLDGTVIMIGHNYVFNFKSHDISTSGISISVHKFFGYPIYKDKTFIINIFSNALSQKITLSAKLIRRGELPDEDIIGLKFENIPSNIAEVLNNFHLNSKTNLESSNIQSIKFS